jgi:urea transport system ATP-binding protein
MLETKSLNQFYGGSHILRDVSIQFNPEQLTVLLGRNGVGKTTLLRCLIGLLPIRSGSIVWQGRPLEKLPPYERAALGVGYVPQGREIFPRITVEENLMVGAAAAKSYSKQAFERTYSLFPILRKMKSRRGGDLSGGQQQQLAIGRALMSNPRFLMLDEPTEGIQPSIIQELAGTLRRLATEERITILLVEQYYDFAHSLADNYLVMERGEIVASGKGQDMESDGVRAMIAV